MRDVLAATQHDIKECVCVCVCVCLTIFFSVTVGLLLTGEETAGDDMLSGGIATGGGGAAVAGGGGAVGLSGGGGAGTEGGG